MQIATPGSSYYKVGGALGFKHPTYVTRSADHELLTALGDRQFCYVFNCRQMGKSSLRVRAMRHLERQGMSCASIDITVLGSQISPQQWYGGLITQLFQGFSLQGNIDLKSWFQEQRALSPVLQLSHFVTDVVLPQTGDRPLFIFIDEIDKILSLDFSVDDFFALIRFFYNQRAEDPAFERLTFALFGVATPSDLIQDKTQTLFNIGHAIELRGFSVEEVHPLALGLEVYCDRPRVVLQEILTWTGGQPFLTQKVCQLVLKAPLPICSGDEAQRIEAIVRSQIVENWETQDEPVHLKTIRDRLLRHPPRIARQLGLYRRILRRDDCVTDASSEQTELRLSGLVVQRDGQLQVYNRIYAEVFNLDWIEQQLAQFRPYAEAIAAWEKSNRQDESRLLRGQALEDALQWAELKSLSKDDYQFLAASQEVDKRKALEQERRRSNVKRLEMELAAEQKAKATLSQAYMKAKQRLRTASIILAGSVLGAAIAAGWVGYVLQKQMDIQVKSLEWAGKSAMSQFEFSQIDALLTAMEAGQDLRELVKVEQPLDTFPTTSPIDALQMILDQIRERNHLVGHQASINGISISPNAEMIATASRDGTAKIWTREGAEIVTLEHDGDVYGVSFSPDSQRLATTSDDGTVKVWSRSGQLLMTLRHRSDVYAAQFSPDGQWIATAARDGIAHLWTSQGQWVRSFQGHQQAIYSISFSPDGSQVLTASRDGTAKVWRLDGTVLRSLNNPDVIYSASFSPDGKLVATGGQDGILKLWSGDKVLRTLQGHQGSIYDVSFDPGGQFLITTSEDETVKVWSVEGQPMHTFQGYQGAVYDASLSAQGEFLVTASHEKDARFWDFGQYPLAAQMPTKRKVAAMRISPTGKRVTAFADGMIMIQDQNNQLLKAIQIGDSFLYDIALSPKSDRIIIAFQNGRVEVINFQGQRLRQFQAHEETIYSVAIHPEQDIIATGSRDKTVKIWTLAGQLQQEFVAHQDAVYDVSFSPNGRWLATASSDETAKRWNLEGGLQATLQGHRGAIHQVEFSPDSQGLATASTDETARLWTLDGAEQVKLEHDSGLVFRVGFRPDGHAIATGSKDGTISFWDLQGTLLDQLRGHQSLVMDFHFIGNDQLMAIAQDDSRATLWPQTSSVTRRLEHLLQEGCGWLHDYLAGHPERKMFRCTARKPELSSEIKE